MRGRTAGNGLTGRTVTIPDPSAPFDATNFDRIVAEKNEKNKHTDSLFAIVAWIGSSIWWISTTPEAHFFTWQTAALLVPGMFAASLILGGGSYLAMRVFKL